MSVTFGFYNSLDHDRKYNSEQVSRMFDGLINDGIFSSIGSSLIVQEGTGMQIAVGTGKAWFNHTWTNNDAILPLEVQISELALNRIDVVVLEVDGSPEVRFNDIKIIKGTPGSIPVAPVMIHTEYLHQYPLAHVYVGAGVTSIIQANITNKVGTDDCPLVTGIVQQVSVEDLLLQWQDEFQQWYLAAQEEVEQWKNTEQTDFDSWVSNFKSEANDWWASKQTDFLNWLAYIDALFGDDPAGALQAQIDILKNSQGIAYDNAISGLAATNVKAALDEINAKAGGTGVFMVGKTTVFGESDITETFTADGSTLVTTFNVDETITEVYTVSGHTTTKTITFNPDGSISEVIS